jgi:hypothetical protein
LRHTFASLGPVSGESAFNVARAMGHSRFLLVDLAYAHSLQLGMASVAERLTARVFREQPKLRVIEGGQPPVATSLQEQPAAATAVKASA